MKYCTCFLVGLWLASTSAFGALSVKDYEKLNAMFKESEGRMKEYVSQELAQESAKVNAEFAKVNAEIAKVHAEIAKVHAEIKRVDSRIDETNKRIETEARIVRDRFGDLNNRLNVILGMVGALIVVIIGLPLLRDRKKDSEQDEQLEAQKQQLAAQQELIDKQQEQLAAQQQKMDAQQQLLAAQQQEIDAVRDELATLKQKQMPGASATE